MRKGSLLLVALLVLTTGAFAEITGVGAPTFSGSVETNWGYDLDEEASGFYNDSSISLVLPLLDGSTTAGGDDGMYGEITIDGIGWQMVYDNDSNNFYDVDEDDEGAGADVLDVSISAKLVLNSLFVTLGNPDYAMNNVDISDDYAVDANLFQSEDNSWGHGIGVGFMNEMVTVEVKIASINDGYMDDTDDDTEVSDSALGPFDNDLDDGDDLDYTSNADNLYVFGAEATITPADGVSIPVSFAMQSEDVYGEALMGFGMAPSITSGPLTIDIPVDYVSVGDMSGYELEPAVTFAVMDNLSVGLDILYAGYADVFTSPTITSAATTGGSEVVNAIMDTTLTVTDSGQFVPGLSNTVEFGLSDMMDWADVDADMGWYLSVDSEFATNGLTPYVNFGYGSDKEFDLGLGIIAGADATGIDNTTFTLDYTNDCLSDGATDAADGGDESESGRVTFNVTVSF